MASEVLVPEGGRRGHRGPPSAALLQVCGQEQPRGQEVQVPIADLHLPLALQVSTCRRAQAGASGLADHDPQGPGPSSPGQFLL